MHARTVLTASLAFVLFSSSCCCCSTEWLEVPETASITDEPEIERVAREYATQHAPELFAPLDGGSGGCLSGAAALAIDLGVAVITRGHASNDAAGRVTFDLTACAKRVSLAVFVVKTAGAFVAVGAIVYDGATRVEVRRLGAPPPFTEVDTSADIDELF